MDLIIDVSMVYKDKVGHTANKLFSMCLVWAPGENSFSLPNNVGALYMDASGFNSIILEIHYNNPNLVPDIVDNSGVRFYYTTKLRENNLRVYQYGDPLIFLNGETVDFGTQASPTGMYEHSFNCASSCSALFLSSPVTVVREYLHMHKTTVYNEIQQETEQGSEQDPTRSRRD